MDPISNPAVEALLKETIENLYLETSEFLSDTPQNFMEIMDLLLDRTNSEVFRNYMGEFKISNSNYEEVPARIHALNIVDNLTKLQRLILGEQEIINSLKLEKLMPSFDYNEIASYCYEHLNSLHQQKRPITFGM